ncbi:MAG: hypothetical protein ACH0QD_04485 [Tepidibacillus sp.]
MLYLVANDQVKKRFQVHLKNLETNLEKAKLALIVRSNETKPEVIDEIINKTDATLAVVVMTGQLDTLGKQIQNYALQAGIPEDYILTGTDWRMSAIKEKFEQIIKDPVFPDAKVFTDETPLFEDFQLENKEISNFTTNNRLLVVTGWSGGVGKTTLASSLASYYNARGLNTLLLDTSLQGDTAYHYGLSNPSNTLHGTEFGELLLTNGKASAIQQGLQRNYNLVIADVSSDSEHAKKLMEIASHILVVLQPSELDYFKIKNQIETLNGKKVVLCMNRVDETKPLRSSFVSFIENEFSQLQMLVVNDSDDVASAFAEKKPAYYRSPFDLAIPRLATFLELD